MNQQTIRTKIISELRAGHLSMAMELLKDNKINIDKEIQEEAVKACVNSLKRHFHWIIPLFVKTFKIHNDSRLNELAGKIIALALQHGQPLIADVAARTFGIELGEDIEELIEEEKANLIGSLKQSDVVVMQNASGEYNFELK